MITDVPPLFVAHATNYKVDVVFIFAVFVFNPEERNKVLPKRRLIIFLYLSNGLLIRPAILILI